MTIPVPAPAPKPETLGTCGLWRHGSVEGLAHPENERCLNWRALPPAPVPGEPSPREVSPEVRGAISDYRSALSTAFHDLTPAAAGERLEAEALRDLEAAVLAFARPQPSGEPAPRTDDLDELERLAREATPGPWEVADDGNEREIVSRAWEDETPAVCGKPHSRWWDLDDCDARFIAAANPSTVLRLVSELRALRAERGTGR